MAYDASRGRVVLTGGSEGNPDGAALPDAWEWDGTAWQEITPLSSERPEPVHSHAVVYDAQQARVVEIGGTNGIFSSGRLAPDQIWSLGCGAPPADTDADGEPDSSDNCIDVANGPLLPGPAALDQRDTDGDGYGNACDPDFNNDGVVNAVDLAVLKAQFFHAGPNLAADLNGDGVVNAVDLARLKARFFQPPGPSALAP